MKFVLSKAKLALLAGAALSSTSAWSAPLADAAAHTRTETVRYQPSQAATAEGAAALYEELRAAAIRVCTEPQAPISRSAAMEEGMQSSCTSDALASAVRKVGIPMVSVLHQYSRAGRTLASR